MDKIASWQLHVSQLSVSVSELCTVSLRPWERRFKPILQYNGPSYVLIVMAQSDE